MSSKTSANPCILSRRPTSGGDTGSRMREDDPLASELSRSLAHHECAEAEPPALFLPADDFAAQVARTQQLQARLASVHIAIKVLRLTLASVGSASPTDARA
jgi:hypothetical protein